MDVRQIAMKSWDFSLYEARDGSLILKVMFSEGDYKIDVGRFFVVDSSSIDRNDAESLKNLAARIRAEYPSTFLPQVGKSELNVLSGFAKDVAEVVGPLLATKGFTLDQVDDGKDDAEGGRHLSVVYYRGSDCKIQIYESAREGETNCMIGSLDAPNVLGLRKPSRKWQYFGRFVPLPDLPLDELIEKVRAEHGSYATPLHWVRSRIEKYYDAAHQWRGLRAPKDLLTHLKVGDFFDDTTRLITSLDLRVGDDLALGADSGRPPRLLSIEGHDGVDISQLPRYIDEVAEIVSLRGSRFEVVSRNVGSGGMNRILLRRIRP
jgi:hypothetical protein